MFTSLRLGFVLVEGILPHKTRYNGEGGNMRKAYKVMVHRDDTGFSETYDVLSGNAAAAAGASIRQALGRAILPSDKEVIVSFHRVENPRMRIHSRASSCEELYSARAALLKKGHEAFVQEPYLMDEDRRYILFYSIETFDLGLGFVMEGTEGNYHYTELDMMRRKQQGATGETS